MIQSGVPTVGIEELKDPNAIEQGTTKETRIYYRQATLTQHFEKASGKELFPATPELAKEINKKVALGEVEVKVTKIWIPTTPLPADPWHLNYYMRKGFKLWPPGQEPEGMGDKPPEKVEVKAAGNVISCPVEGCSTTFKSFIGLARHMAKVHGKK